MAQTSVKCVEQKERGMNVEEGWRMEGEEDVKEKRTLPDRHNHHSCRR